MNSIKTVLLLLSLLFSQLVYADLIGVGYAKSVSEAKKEALADLSQVIKSEVRTNFESKTSVKADRAEAVSNSNIKVSSNLPILGAEFKYIESPVEVIAEVVLVPAKVSSLYTKKLQTISDEIESLLQEIKKSKSNSLKLGLYSDVFSLLKEYDRYESVATILGSKIINRPITKATVKARLAELDSDIDSLDMASKVVAKSFSQKNIFVYPPLLQNNTTVAEFGSVFQKNLKSYMGSSSRLEEASYMLVGEYTLTETSMVLNYELLSTKTNEVVASKTITLNNSIYNNLQTKPKNIDFDALLNAGVVSSSDLKVSLNSNRGSENLLFHNNEDIELFVKLNKMGYIYIVGYTQTSQGKFSYLLELNESSGISKFIKFINADDASRWISLGAFTVGAPFGVESIQVVASNKKITSLPNTIYDEKSGYYIISNDIEKALSQTRGLKMKKSKKAEYSEDVMSFTTMK